MLQDEELLKLLFISYLYVDDETSVMSLTQQRHNLYENIFVDKNIKIYVLF